MTVRLSIIFTLPSLPWLSKMTIHRALQCLWRQRYFWFIVYFCPSRSWDYVNTRMLLISSWLQKKKRRAFISDINCKHSHASSSRNAAPLGDAVLRERGQLFIHAMFYESAETFSILYVIISGGTINDISCDRFTAFLHNNGVRVTCLTLIYTVDNAQVRYGSLCSLVLQ